MELFTTTSIGNTLSEITASISANIGGILAIFGFIVGLSIVMALIDNAKEGRIMEQRVRDSNRRYGIKR